MPRVRVGLERPKVENCPVLDIGYLYRENLLHSNRTFTLASPAPQGQSGAHITVTADGDDALVLNFGSTTQSVPIVWTALYPLSPHCRGVQLWFRCPYRGADGKLCGRRAAKLYLRGHLFGCRQCLGLAYRSQSQSSRFRAGTKAQQIRQRLGGSPNLFDPFPPRPKWTQMRHYLRLLDQAQNAAQRWARLQRGS
jgi:hypothetical protein